MLSALPIPLHPIFNFFLNFFNPRSPLLPAAPSLRGRELLRQHFPAVTEQEGP